jgi:NADPH:quinone reductase-like Zn-dependent oxidoreductase
VTVKAVVYARYGGPEVLEVRDVPQDPPTDDEVLVQVRAASLNPIDWKIMRGDLKLVTGRRMPRRAGCDFAGVVVALGRAATGFNVGDAVFGKVAARSGRQGSFAEFVCAPEAEVCLKPAEISFAEAAALPIAGVSALDCLRRLGGARSGQRVLIIGAAGGVGSFSVQLATLWGLRVTAVCHSSNTERVRQLGANDVVAYDREDPLTRREVFDLILDLAAKYSFGRCAHLLTARGIYVNTMPGPRTLFDAFRTRFFGGRRARVLMAKINRAALEELAGLVACGQIKADIGATFRRDEIRAAYELSISGHARGKIVVEEVAGKNVSAERKR